MSTASMALLQGAKETSEKTEKIGNDPAADTVAKELEKTEAPAEETEEVVFDLEKMNSAELDACVKDNDLEVPGNWATLTTAAKRDYLEKTYGENPEAEAAELEAAELTAVEPEEKSVVNKATAQKKPKATVQKKPKSNSKAVSKEVAEPVKGEVIAKGEDLIIDVAQEVENLTKKDALGMVVMLRETTEFNYFKLGGVLAIIQANAWYDPYPTFKEYVEAEHGINYRKAMYLVSIYNGVVEAGVPWSKLKGIGWTKLKEIVDLLSPTTADKWLKIADSQSTIKLIEMVKAEKAKQAGTAPEDKTPKVITTKTFKVHQDQLEIIGAALTKAKDEGQTEVDTVALEYICQSYLSGGSVSVTKTEVDAGSMTTVMQDMGVEPTLEAVGKAFPSLVMTVDEEGLSAA